MFIKLLFIYLISTPITFATASKLLTALLPKLLEVSFEGVTKSVLEMFSKDDFSLNKSWKAGAAIIISGEADIVLYPN